MFNPFLHAPVAEPAKDADDWPALLAWLDAHPPPPGPLVLWQGVVAMDPARLWEVLRNAEDCPAARSQISALRRALS